MKTLKYFVLFMFLFSCKTKTVTTEKEFITEKESASRYFDSVFKESLDLHLDYQKRQWEFNDNLKLSSISDIDSSGNRKPFHYKHFVDGKLKEEIYLEGGEINKQTDSKQYNQSEKKDEIKSEKTRIEVDVGYKKETKKKTLNKNKKADVKGFQFGFYLWLFLIIIVLIVLNWISKKIKLPDIFKKMFGKNEG
ncbi:hypothetical protein LNQ49_12685 [Flavobacterium sp. F-65]|uniref:PepSY-associated TM region n=1 Tax=Flavobacterium pisciphilum TaxID=2893755 RepID=A0ABS8MUL2_9FLAO|nr:hypothetical protein [Flavobacterium sp. F-65]MCC9072439.1 hypothetical protein [Flavobacterium sp. F-65]